MDVVKCCTYKMFKVRNFIHVMELKAENNTHSSVVDSVPDSSLREL
jgi:hypothetical protein